jgi:hypothetical protein
MLGSSSSRSTRRATHVTRPGERDNEEDDEVELEGVVLIPAASALCARPNAPIEVHGLGWETHWHVETGVWHVCVACDGRSVPQWGPILELS